MVIAALVLWVLTAGAGAYLLATGNTARRAAASSDSAIGAQATPGSAQATPATAQAPATSEAPATAQAPATREAPPIPRTKVTAAPGEHPLLEFCHPALGLIGLACWFVYAGIHYRPLAWISFGVLVVVIGLGLGWLAGNALAARRRGNASPARFAPRLILLHGAGAAATLTLAALTALAASHG